MSPDQLESELESFCGSPHVVVCNSGTSAIQLVWQTLMSTGRIDANTPVFCNDFTMVACARALKQCGLSPTFVVPDVSDFQMNMNHLNDLLMLFSKNGKEPLTEWGLLLCHVYGSVASKEKLLVRLQEWEIKGYIKEGSLILVEDCAEVHGYKPFLTYSNRFIKPGNHAAIWSFYRNKIVAGEEGGCLAFADRTYYPDLLQGQRETAKSLRCLGFKADENVPSYDHNPGGGNYRLSPTLADKVHQSFLQFPVRDEWRRQVIDTVVISSSPTYASSWKLELDVIQDFPWMLVFTIGKMSLRPETYEPAELLRDEVASELVDAEFSPRYGFKGMTTQAEFKGVQPEFNDSKLLSACTFLVPIFDQHGYPLTDDKIQKLVRILK